MPNPHIDASQSRSYPNSTKVYMLTISQLCQVRPSELTTSRLYTDGCRRPLNVDFRTSRNRHFEIDRHSH